MQNTSDELKACPKEDFTSLLKRLDEDGQTGLDLSPGNRLSQAAADAIRQLQRRAEEAESKRDEWKQFCEQAREREDATKADNLKFQKQIAEKDRLFNSIKSLVCGDKIPMWKNDYETTRSRSQIADICDLSATPAPSSFVHKSEVEKKYRDSMNDSSPAVQKFLLDQEFAALKKKVEGAEARLRIYSRCPACGNDTLVINKGHLLCSWHECPNPTAIDK